MLGRFLEISVHAPNALESLEFYQRLGFSSAEVGETWSHPYGVVTDGRISIGLHQYEFDSPSLTFVKPDLWRHLPALEALGIEFAFRKLGENVFNEAGFKDPNGLMITMLEARTFSPPAREPAEVSACGYFAEFGIPCSDAEASKRFWEQLGFVAMEEVAEPVRRIPLTSDFLDIGLYTAREPRHPVVTFVDPDMPRRISRIVKLGIEPSPRLPPSFDRETTALFVAPEGTPLLLMTGEV
jgi:catechol 2,3-dioxygenase-like lactoylglutathione lyase family enzyme